MNEEKRPEVNPDIVGGPMAPDPNSPVEVVDIQFRTGSKVYFFDPNGMELSQGNHVIIETTRGPEYGTCASGNHTVSFKDIVPPLRKVLRIATESDEKTLETNRAKEKRAYEICQQKIQEHKLDMQLVSAEYAFDGSKILFFFTSDERVDFRELVKHLAGIFRTRIELRQIGVRDKAEMVGGLGICGRPFCCTEFLKDFQPVSIKMAKTQNLSLNPTKISGTCGRLMCCLKYEQETYEELIRTSPKAESFVDTPDGRGTVTEVSLLRQTVKVRMEEAPDTIGTYHNSEIYVIRNGKAKKNDPPIPADLAPISGNGKRPRPAVQEETEAPMQLDPIRFRYRPDDIVEEQETPKPEEQRKKKSPADNGERERKEAPKKEMPKEQQADQQKPQAPAHRRRGGGQKHRDPHVQEKKAVKKPENPQKGEKPVKPETEQEGGKPKNNYRRRRPNQRPKKPSTNEGSKQGDKE